MKVKACSDFIREGKRRGEQGSAPRPRCPGREHWAEVLGVHLKEQKTNILLISTDIKHTPRVQVRLLTSQRVFSLNIPFS